MIVSSLPAREREILRTPRAFTHYTIALKLPKKPEFNNPIFGSTAEAALTRSGKGCIIQTPSASYFKGTVILLHTYHSINTHGGGGNGGIAPSFLTSALNGEG
jgi:hypothetical protein